MSAEVIALSLQFSYRHLYYFCVVAKEGSISRGAARLGMAVQTVSAQMRELERSLGHVLLNPAGRGLVLADRPGTANPSLKVYSHAISTSPVVWCAPPALVAAAKRDVPHSLARVPLQLSTTHAMLRSRLEPWLDCEGVRPNVVGDFEDSSLLKTFGASGMGVFPAVEGVHDDLVERYGVKRIGRSEGVKEHFYAIGTEKKVLHPLVQRLH